MGGNNLMNLIQKKSIVLQDVTLQMASTSLLLSILEQTDPQATKLLLDFSCRHLDGARSN